MTARRLKPTHWAVFFALSASLFGGCNCGRHASLQRAGVCTTGDTQSCGPQQVGECRPGTQTCTGKNEWGPCEGAVYPTAEVCDGKDNDCDGKVDDLPDAGGAPLVQSCYPGPDGTAGVGACKAGTQTCTHGAWAACEGAVVPSAEICNGIDDDCDGNIDNQTGSTAVLVQACYDGPSGTRGVGACKDGSQSCQGGAWTACAGSVTPTSETCNDVDDDCNGVVDDGIAPQSCYDGPAGTANVGTCHPGFSYCSAGVFGACTGEVTPAAKDACDGLDESCDGTVNGGCPCTPGTSVTCYGGPGGTMGVGPCHAGSQLCGPDGGYEACAGDVRPATESCNGVDDDCDGHTDNQPGTTSALTQSCYDGPAGTRNVGVCHGGTQSCSAGAWGACQNEVTPSAEICDGKDNDCNGAVDNGDPGGGASCNINGLKGPCATGVLACSDGGILCAQTTFPVAETCNNVDDDCDGITDDWPDAGPITISPCYTFDAGTPGVGLCRTGFQVCNSGVLGTCTGEVGPAPETCDGKDNDCNGAVDDGVDAGPTCTVAGKLGPCAVGVPVCSGASGFTCQQVTFPTVESCNGRDDDCNGTIDDGNAGGGASCTVPGLKGPCAVGTLVCSDGGLVCVQTTFPQPETCDGQDQDCDGIADDFPDAGPITKLCFPFGSGTPGVGVCRYGTQTCSGGSFGSCTGAVGPQAEVCDGLDNDCDGRADRYPDAGPLMKGCYDGPAGTGFPDGGGVGLCHGGVAFCSGGSYGTCTNEVLPATETCNGQDDDCNGVRDDGNVGAGAACSTGKPGVCAAGTLVCAGDAGLICQQTTGPSPETCDGLDNDCDGRVDNIAGSTSPLTQSCYTGPSGTLNVGICKAGTQTCTGGSYGTCTGEVLPTTETCNGKDDNCNGTVDDGIDAGSASCSTGLYAPCDVGHLACAADGGSVCVQNFTGDAGDGDLDGYSRCYDCNDNNAAVHPGATEVCDGVDNNCNGQVDEGFDSDKDCYTTCGTQYAKRTKYSDAGCDYADMVDGGLTDTSKVDCDDTNANIHPDIACDCGAYNPSTNTCGTTADGKDNNCNGKIDETCACSNVDNDGDGYSPCQGDCNDNNPNIHPGAPELCNGIDDDCNPLTTDNCDVGQPCGFDGGADTCKSRYICATDVATGVSSCGDLCNYSSVGAGVGDGCLDGTACGANLIASDNDHVCVPASTQGSGAAGSSCTSNSQCRSNTCNTTLGKCTDLCGNTSYCGSLATCVIEDFAASPGLSYTEVYGGYCWPNSSALGTATQGQSCGGSGRNAVYCESGSLACYQATNESGTHCHDICCKQSDCPSGNFCGQGPSKNVGTFSSGYPADTGVPACVPKLSGQGSRTAGQACTSSLQCASDLCDANLHVCLDFCCNDSSCPTGLSCEFVTVVKNYPSGCSGTSCHQQQMRLCVAPPTQTQYKIAP